MCTSPSLTGSAGPWGSAQRFADSPDPSSSERCAPCWTCSARRRTSSPRHLSLWKPSGQSLSTSCVADLQREGERRHLIVLASKTESVDQHMTPVKMVFHVSLKYLRRGGPNSTASSAFRLSFCLCRWSNIFNCIDINDGSFAAILKYGEGEKSALKTEFLSTQSDSSVHWFWNVQSKNMLFKCFDVALAGSYKRLDLGLEHGVNS